KACDPARLRAVPRAAIHSQSRTPHGGGVALLFPVFRKGRIEWLPATPLRVLRLLRTPNYTADYYYGRRTLRPARGEQQARWIRLPESRWLIARDHHEPYISREEGSRVQELLQGRGSMRGRRPPAGRGPGLLQSLIGCA